MKRLWLFMIEPKTKYNVQWTEMITYRFSFHLNLITCCLFEPFTVVFITSFGFCFILFFSQKVSFFINLILLLYQSLSDPFIRSFIHFLYANSSFRTAYSYMVIFHSVFPFILNLYLQHFGTVCQHLILCSFYTPVFVFFFDF